MVHGRTTAAAINWSAEKIREFLHLLANLVRIDVVTIRDLAQRHAKDLPLNVPFGVSRQLRSCGDSIDVQLFRARAVMRSCPRDE